MFEGIKQTFKAYFEVGKMLGREARERKKRKKGRKGALDPRIGLGLAATFIVAYLAIMIIANIEPEVASSIPSNSTLYQTYQTFSGYTAKSFKMWGLAIFIGVLGLVIGAIYGFMRAD